jgi:hypothetical protein
MLFAMQVARSSGFNSIPSATGGIARLACARLDEMGKDPAVILSKVGLTPEDARDPAARLEVRTQIKLLELAAEEVQDEWLGFHLARSFDLREIGLVYYVIASSEQLADALRNAERYSQIINEGVRLRFRMQDGSAVIALDYVNVDRHADRHHIVLAGDAGAHLPTGDERPFVAFTAEDKTPPKWDACRNQNILRRRHRIWR